MVDRLKGCAAAECVTRKDAFLGAGLTIGAALVVAGIMLIGNSELTETIGLVMFPGVLGIGTISMNLRGHSWPARIAPWVGSTTASVGGTESRGSITLTTKEALPVLPEASVAVQVTTVSPRGKRLPGGGEHTTWGLASQASWTRGTT